MGLCQSSTACAVSHVRRGVPQQDRIRRIGSLAEGPHEEERRRGVVDRQYEGKYRRTGQAEEKGRSRARERGGGKEEKEKERKERVRKEGQEKEKRKEEKGELRDSGVIKQRRERQEEEDSSSEGSQRDLWVHRIGPRSQDAQESEEAHKEAAKEEEKGRDFRRGRRGGQELNRGGGERQPLVRGGFQRYPPGARGSQARSRSPYSGHCEGDAAAAFDSSGHDVVGRTDRSPGRGVAILQKPVELEGQRRSGQRVADSVLGDRSRSQRENRRMCRLSIPEIEVDRSIVDRHQLDHCTEGRSSTPRTGSTHEQVRSSGGHEGECGGDEDEGLDKEQRRRKRQKRWLEGSSKRRWEEQRQGQGEARRREGRQPEELLRRGVSEDAAEERQQEETEVTAQMGPAGHSFPSTPGNSVDIPGKMPTPSLDCEDSVEANGGMPQEIVDVSKMTSEEFTGRRFFHEEALEKTKPAQVKSTCGKFASRCRGARKKTHLVVCQRLRDSGGEKRAARASEICPQHAGHDLSGLHFQHALPLIETMLKNNHFGKLHGKAKTTGDVFPLPTSIDILKGLGICSDDEACALRCLCMGLNSYAGVTLEYEGSMTSLQKDLLEGMRSELEEILGWDETFEEISWSSFFSTRSIDYMGDEVATAKSTSWANLKSAIPREVGSVDLAAMVDEGCRHYVCNFEDYLLPPESQVYTKPPRVMIADENWDEVCQGLLDSGICSILAEDELYHIGDQPLLNGLFGVSKGEVVDQHEVHRLIMNLIPVNNICRSFQGDVATLPAWSSGGSLQLMPSQNLLVSSEDVRCFFYIFRVPAAWKRFLGFNKVVDSKLHPGDTRKHYLVSNVLPMGFKNSVSVAQAVHRSIVKRASKRAPGSLLAHQELRKDRAFPAADTMHRVYLDNFDELEKVDVTMADMIKGTASPGVLALRAEYEEWGIPRHPKKAVERSLKAEVQGAMVNGERGCAYPKPSKVLKYTQLALLTLQVGKCSQKEMQVIAGGLVYIATFRRALMGGLNAIWKFIESFNGFPPVIRLEIPSVVKLEISRFLSMVALARIDFRLEVNPQVTASDASTSGGGVTVSRGLTNIGQMAASCRVRGDVPDVDDLTQVLTIGLFDGIGALRVAADAVGLPVAGHVSVEVNQVASRVLESKFPATTFVNNVEDVNEMMAKDWACQYSQVGIVLLGAGPPCQGVSGLNADRRGALRDHRSRLHSHVSRIRDLLRKSFPWAQVHTVMESVLSMDEADRQVMSQDIGMLPYAIDAAGVSLARRPRLYWVSWELHSGGGAIVTSAPGSEWHHLAQVDLHGQVDESRYLTPGWTRSSEEPFPTFTTARPRGHPGRRPAGLDKLSDEERQEWEEDSFRFPPYQYQHKYQVWKGSSHRLVNTEERETILGFPRGYTTQCVPKSQQKTIEHDDLRKTLLGNSWSVTVVSWLLAQLGAQLGLIPPMTVQDCIDATAPGAATHMATFLSRPLMRGPNKALRPGNEAVLAKKLVNLVSIKGEDILLTAQTEDTLRYHRLRASIPANLWKWRTVCGWTWRGPSEHINVLELRAVLCALRWKVVKQKASRQKMIHLTDSLVCLHTLTRGRTSSKKLRRTLARINALLLLSRSTAVWTYIHTALNPADAPSRGKVRKKWVNA